MDLGRWGDPEAKLPLEALWSSQCGVYLCFPDTFPTHDGLHAQDSVGKVPPKPQHGFAENLTRSMVSQSHQFRSPRDPCFRS